MRATRAGFVAAVLASAVAALAGPAPLAAQRTGEPAALTGRAALAATGEPVPFSLVTLVPEAGGAERAALTGADGAFRFDSLAAGVYRLRLDRVGFVPELQPPIRIAAGRVESAVVRSTPRRLPPPAASAADTTCRAPSEVPGVPALGALWREARTAAEARRLFDATHSYTLVLRDLSWTAAAGSRVRAAVSETPRTHTPESALVEQLQASAPESVWGRVSPGGFQVLVPDLPQLFGRGFLAVHCVRLLSAAPGEHRLHFTPRDSLAGSGRVRVAATLVLDSTFQVTGLELEYTRDGHTFARGVEAFSDPGFPGGQLRFARRLDMVEIPRLAGTSHWVGRTHYDDYRIVRDTLP